MDLNPLQLVLLGALFVVAISILVRNAVRREWDHVLLQAILLVVAALAIVRPGSVGRPNFYPHPARPQPSVQRPLNPGDDIEDFRRRRQESEEYLRNSAKRYDFLK